MVTLIILFIVLVLALLILPFSKALMKDKQDLQQSPIEVRFKVLIDEINNSFLLIIADKSALFLAVGKKHKAALDEEQ